MKKQMKIMLVLATILSLTACEKGGLLSPARNVSGIWKGTLTSSENNAAQINTVTDIMVLDLTQNGNYVTGDMCFGSYCGSLTGTISGTTIEFTSIIGNGCINVHGTFTSSNMEGMRNSNPPPYITCGDVLNDGHGSKGIEWHLKKL
jgi:predicted small lipoprotein YifL